MIHSFNIRHGKGSINAGTREYLYVNSPTGMCAIVEKTGSNTKTWRTFTDYLGSVVYAENMDNTLEKRHYSYDAWGNPRRHNDWQNREPLYQMIGDRGFTSHVQ